MKLDQLLAMVFPDATRRHEDGTVDPAYIEELAEAEAQRALRRMGDMNEAMCGNREGFRFGGEVDEGLGA